MPVDMQTDQGKALLYLTQMLYRMKFKDVCMHFDKDGLSVNQMNNAETVSIRAKIHADAMVYTCTEPQTVYLTNAMIIDKFKSIKDQHVQLYLDDVPKVLQVVLKKNKRTTSTDCSFSPESPDIKACPDVVLTKKACRVRMSSKRFYDMLTELSGNEDDFVTIRVTKGMLYMSGKAVEWTTNVKEPLIRVHPTKPTEPDKGKDIAVQEKNEEVLLSNVTPPKEDGDAYLCEFSEEVVSRYPYTTLIDIAKGHSMDGSIEWRMETESPLMIDYTLCNVGNVHIMLSPHVQQKQPYEDLQFDDNIGSVSDNTMSYTYESYWGGSVDTQQRVQPQEEHVHKHNENKCQQTPLSSTSTPPQEARKSKNALKKRKRTSKTPNRKRSRK